MPKPVQPFIARHTPSPTKAKPAPRPERESAAPRETFTGSVAPQEDKQLKPIDRRAEMGPDAVKTTGYAAGLTMLLLTGVSVLGSLQVGPAKAQPAVVATQQNPTVLAQTDDAQQIVANRQGELLSQGRILKQDHFPTLHRSHLGPQVEGAPNFRGLDEQGIYGVAQPTVNGAREVLDRLGAKDREVVWSTMREEPVVYIDGVSFNLRLQNHPFENLDAHKGISSEGVEAQEEQLKREVLAEAFQHGGRLLVHGEGEDGSVTNRWIDVNITNVQTPKEVFNQLKEEGYQVRYARVPVTDELAPENKDFDALIKHLGGVDAETPLVFNCHAGRGRTTTAMVISDLLRSAQRGEDQAFTRNEGVREDIKEKGQYQTGNYRVILELIKSLQGGSSSKESTDAAIDRHDDIQNLREAVEKYKKRFDGGDQKSLKRGLDYLNRYFQLINFDAYLKEQAPAGFEKSFEDWNREHQQQLQPLLENMQLAQNGQPGTGPRAA